jgi:hypothetical protein
MKKKIFLMSSILLMILFFIFTDCQKKSIVSSCEYVINRNGPSYLKVINELNSDIDVDLTAFLPFGATINPMTCEIYGIPTGNKQVTILKSGTQIEKTINFSIGDGETYTINVTGSFFN